jgi:hypothetical protein
MIRGGLILAVGSTSNGGGDETLGAFRYGTPGSEHHGRAVTVR